MRRRLLIAVAGVALLMIVVVGVQVQIARTGPRLDDEVGFRPRGLPVGSGSTAREIVWLGDSTSTGVGVSDVRESMAYRVVAALEDSARLTILGRSGDQVHEVLDDQIPALQRRIDRGGDPDVIYVSIGANDVTALTRRPTFRTRYRSLVDQVAAMAPDAEIVLVGIPDMGTAPRIPVPLRQLAGVRASQLDDAIEDVAANAGVHHVDLAERTSSIFSSDPDRYFSDDEFHPSREGHRIWAEAVVESVTSSAG